MVLFVYFSNRYDMKKEQYERIETMEKIHNTANKTLLVVEKALEQLEKEVDNCEILFDYYTNADWAKDVEASKQPWFPSPKELPHGILTEDAIFETIGQYRELAIRMLKLGTKMIEY